MPSQRRMLSMKVYVKSLCFCITIQLCNKKRKSFANIKELRFVQLHKTIYTKKYFYLYAYIVSYNNEILVLQFLQIFIAREISQYDGPPKVLILGLDFINTHCIIFHYAVTKIIFAHNIIPYHKLLA